MSSETEHPADTDEGAVEVVLPRVLTRLVGVDVAHHARRALALGVCDEACHQLIELVVHVALEEMHSEGLGLVEVDLDRVGFRVCPHVFEGLDEASHGVEDVVAEHCDLCPPVADDHCRGPGVDMLVTVGMVPVPYLPAEPCHFGARADVGLTLGHHEFGVEDLRGHLRENLVGGVAALGSRGSGP